MSKSLRVFYLTQFEQIVSHQLFLKNKNDFGIICRRKVGENDVPINWFRFMYAYVSVDRFINVKCCSFRGKIQ